MKITRVLTIFWFISIIVLSGSYVLTMYHPSLVFDGTTFFLSIVICLMVLLGLRWAQAGDVPMLGVLSFFLLINYMPRLASYGFAPTVVSFPFPRLDLDEINMSLGYITLGVFACVAAILGSGRLHEYLTAQRRKEPPVCSPDANAMAASQQVAATDKSWRTNSWRTMARKLWTLFDSIPSSTLALGFLLYVAMDLYISAWLGVNPYNNVTEKSKFHYLWVGMRVLVGTDTAFALVFGTILLRLMKSKWEYFWLLLIGFAYLFLLTAAGSKAGILRIIIVIACFGLINFPVQRIRFRSYFLLIVTLVLMGPPNFMLGGYFRTWYQDKLQGTERAQGSISQVFQKIYVNRRPPKVVDRNEEPKTVVEPTRLETFIDFMMPMFNRLGEVDYPLFIISRTTQEQRGMKYLTGSYVVKSFINWLVPGTPFPDALVPTSRIIPILYRRGSENYVMSSFNSEPMSIWGGSFLYLGYFGGLLWIILATAGLNLAFRKSVESKNSDSKILGGFFLWALGLTFFQFFGFDHLFSLMVFLGIQAIVAVVYFRVLDYLSKRGPQLRWPTGLTSKIGNLIKSRSAV